MNNYNFEDSIPKMIYSINFFIFLQKKIFLKNKYVLRILAFPKII
jgi:hypothetical protein